MTPPADPRTERTRSVVLAATVELLVEHGFERITIDGIAERSGVARSTIYRNWPERHRLLTEAFEILCDVPATPETGTFEGDLRVMARALAHGLTAERWGHTLPSLVSAASRDDELKTAQMGFNARRRAAIRAIFDQGVERGEIKGGPHIEAAVTRFVAPFFFGRLIAHIPLDDHFIEQMVRATLAELAP